MSENASENAATFAADTSDREPVTAPGIPAPVAPDTETSAVSDAPSVPAPDAAPTTGTPPVADSEVPVTVPVDTGDVDTVDETTEAKALDLSDVDSTLRDDWKDSETIIADIHRMVADVHREVLSIKPLIEDAGPTIKKIADEVKDKGIAGLIPLIFSGKK